MQSTITSYGHYSHTLSLLKFVGDVFNIICPKPNECTYDYEIRNTKRNDSLWQRLFSASKNDSFNTKNIRSLFATQRENVLEKKDKLLTDKVDFDVHIFNKFIESQNHQV